MERGNGRWNEDVTRGRRRTRRIAGAGLLAALCAAFLFAGQFTDSADGKKKKKFNFVGKYQGTTEDGGTVSFTLTRGGKILGFTLTNAKLWCFDHPVDPGFYGAEATQKTFTITHGPIAMKEKSRKWPQGKRFEVIEPVPRDTAGDGGSFEGKFVDLSRSPPDADTILPGIAGKGMVGEVSYAFANGPTPPEGNWAPGTEACETGRRLIDWKAKKPGTPGFLPDLGSPGGVIREIPAGQRA